LEEDHRIKKHPDYPEYARLKMRELQLLRQGKAVWPECIGNEKATVQYIEASKRRIHARKTMVAIEKKFRREMGREEQRR
jgi:hypothetical protein